MKIGYCRVSTDDQNLNLQLDALTAAGCEVVHQERKSGRKFARAELNKALGALQPGDELIVWRLCRLGRDMRQTVNIILDMDERGIRFRSLTQEFLDPKTPLGRGVLSLIASLDEDEVETLRERTRAGLAAARRRGKRLGRPAVLTPEKLDLAHRLLAEKKGRAEVARMIGVDPATLRRHLNAKPANDDGDFDPFHQGKR